MRPNADRTGVVFGIDAKVPEHRGNAAQRREHDKRIGAGTMSGAGAACPCCATIMTMGNLRLEGRAGRLGAAMTAVVVDTPLGREYRVPTLHEIEMAAAAGAELDTVFADVPFGLPTESTPKGGSGAARAFSVDGYGLDRWFKLFLPRQLMALGQLVVAGRKTVDALRNKNYECGWIEAIVAAIALGIDRTADRGSSICRPDPTPTQRGIINTFSRFALPIAGPTSCGRPPGRRSKPTAAIRW